MWQSFSAALMLGELDARATGSPKRAESKDQGQLKAVSSDQGFAQAQPSDCTVRIADVSA